MQRHIEDGLNGRAAARRLKISPATGARLVGIVRRDEPLTPIKCGRPGGSGKLGPHRAFLRELVEQDPDITMPELRDALAETGGLLVHETSLSRACAALASSTKKSLVADERRRADVAHARRDWIGRRQMRMRREPHRLVFIDEKSVKTNTTRLRGRAPKGQRLGNSPIIEGLGS